MANALRAAGARGAVAAAFAALGAALILFVTAPWGPGASPDSVTYLSVAESLADGQGWFRFDGRPYVAWPPLYPMALAAGIGAGLEPASSARTLGALAFAITLATLVLTLGRVTGSLAWAALGGLLILASPAMVATHATVWSEGLFSTLTSVAFWLAVRSEPEPRWRDVLALGVVAGAACLTRYLGVVLAAALGVWLLALPAPRQVRLRRFGLFAGVSALGPLIWLLRNVVATGSAAGRRGAALTHLAQNAEHFATSLARTLGLEALGGGAPWLAAALVFGLAGCGLAAAWRAQRRLPAVPTLPALFIVLYATALVGLATWTPVSSLRVLRFGMPVWLPWVLLVGALAAAAWRRWPTGAARVALAAVLAVAAVHGLAATAQHASSQRAEGVYYLGRAEWHGSALIDAVRSRRRGVTVLTNIPHGVYFHTGLPVAYAPRRRGFRSRNELQGTVEQLRRRVAAEGRVPLAWFLFYSPDHGYYTPQELAAEGFCLLGRDRLSDGIYFEITDLSQCPGPRVVPPPGAGPRAAP